MITQALIPVLWGCATEDLLAVR